MLSRDFAQISELEEVEEPSVVESFIRYGTDTGRLVTFGDAVIGLDLVAAAIDALLQSQRILVREAKLISSLWSLIPLLDTAKLQLLLFLEKSCVLVRQPAKTWFILINAPPPPAVAHFDRRLGDNFLKYKFHISAPPVALNRRLISRFSRMNAGVTMHASGALFSIQGQVLASVTFAGSTLTIRAQPSPEGQALLLGIADCVEALLAEYTLQVNRKGTLPSANLPEASGLTHGTQLGIGAGGAVSAALWQGRRVAVKHFASGLPVANLWREMSIALSIKHPNVVNTLARLTTTPPGLVMELLPLRDLCRGFRAPDAHLRQTEAELEARRAALDQERTRMMGNLDQLGHLLPTFQELYAELDRAQSVLTDLLLHSDQQLSLDLRLSFMLDIAKGLSALHGSVPPIIHNDLRSPNVFVVSLDPAAPVHAKLGDFGLAQRFYGSCRLRLQTWQWLAPEVLRGEDFGLSADVFSFGMVCWELLHGPGLAVPYAEFTQLQPHQIRRAIIEQALRPSISASANHQFSSSSKFLPLTSLIALCWRTDPLQRPSAAELVTALTLIANEQPEGSKSRLREISAHPAFRDCSREEAEVLLTGKPAGSLFAKLLGSYLIRPSSLVDHFTVSVAVPSGIQHARVQVLAQGFKAEQEFDSLEALLTFYSLMTH
jgi:serine/threonine protein kinase